METEEYREAFVKTMREKFQSSDGRQNLLLLMIDEIRLNIMKKTNKMMTYSEAADLFMEEVVDVTDAIKNRERSLAVKTMMDKFIK